MGLTQPHIEAPPARDAAVDAVLEAVLSGHTMLSIARGTEIPLIATLRALARAGVNRNSPVVSEVVDAADGLLRIALSGLKMRAVETLNEMVAIEAAPDPLDPDQYRGREMARRTAISILQIDLDRPRRTRSTPDMLPTPSTSGDHDGRDGRSNAGVSAGSAGGAGGGGVGDVGEERFDPRRPDAELRFTDSRAGSTGPAASAARSNGATAAALHDSAAPPGDRPPPVPSPARPSRPTPVSAAAASHAGTALDALPIDAHAQSADHPAHRPRHSPKRDGPAAIAGESLAPRDRRAQRDGRRPPAAASVPPPRSPLARPGAHPP